MAAVFLLGSLLNIVCLVFILGGPRPIQFQLSGKRPMNSTNPLMGTRPMTPAPRFAAHKPAPPTPPVFIPSSPSNNEPAKKSPVEIPSTESWRPSLKAYVARAFASVTEGSDKDEMEKLLKEKLTKAYENNTEHLYNWEIEPLPGQRSNKSKGRGGKNKGRGRGIKPSRWDQALGHDVKGERGRSDIASWRDRSNHSRQSPPSRYVQQF